MVKLFSRTLVESLLDLDTAIAAVEAGFLRIGRGEPSGGGVLGLHPPGGSFHVKAAVFPGGEAGRLYLAAKLNANFPGNPGRGLPTIQGLVGLFDAVTGVPLAVLDSAAVTILRTAAASAVAVKHLARRDATTLTIVGCGAQAAAQVTAVARVRPIDRLFAIDTSTAAVRQFVAGLTLGPGVAVSVASDLREATLASDIVITCTPATRPILGAGDVGPGTMVVAVGADNEHKSEIEPALLAGAQVVCDDRSQCARIGDLHHAVAAGLMTADSVRADLAEVVAGGVWGPDGSEVVVFDSTGLPFQDVVVAAVVLERSVQLEAGTGFDFRS